MKHASFMQQGDGSGLKERVEEWILENEDRILEIIDIEYTDHEGIFVATITYID